MCMAWQEGERPQLDGSQMTVKMTHKFYEIPFWLPASLCVLSSTYLALKLTKTNHDETFVNAIQSKSV